MADNLKYLRKLIAAAVAEDHELVCTYGHGEDPDYIGQNKKMALEALTACDEMWLIIRDKATKRRIASAFIITDITNEPEETIADYAGEWMDTWWKDNVGLPA